MPDLDLALFRAWPRLARGLERRAVLGPPTPVEPLALDGLRGRPLWVKRDERSCPLYGGNKPRKLEFLLGAALARRARRLVTTGGLGTHHGLATTILGRDAGLATTLVLVRQPLLPQVEHSLLLQVAWGAELVYAGGVPGAAMQGLRVLLRSQRRGERPSLVPTGGSSSLGNVGLVSAALELAEQVRAGACPEPAEIYLAVGTGGSLAGLVAGCALAGLRSRPVGVLVTDILPPTPRRVARAANATLARLRRLEPALPPRRIGPGDFELVRNRVGGGYGVPDAEAEAAVRAAAEAGLELETTYTGKCMAEIRARASSGALPDGPVLFWNTYNAVDVEARAPEPLDRSALPPRLRQLVAEARRSR